MTIERTFGGGPSTHQVTPHQRDYQKVPSVVRAPIRTAEDRYPQHPVAPEGYVDEWWERKQGNRAVPSLTGPSSVQAYVNHGRWVVLCPDIDCMSAQITSRLHPKFLCVDCANHRSEGLWLTVEFPPEADRIESLLSQRPIVVARNWWPGEPVENLREENTAKRGALMAWTAPATYTVGEVLTAAAMNAISANLNFIVGTTGATVATTQATSSTSYVTLTTAGPAITLTTGTHAVVIVSAKSNSNGFHNTYMGFAISGATTRAASDTTAMEFTFGSATYVYAASRAFYLTGLTAGSNTFTAKYRGSAGTSRFKNRQIMGFPLP